MYKKVIELTNPDIKLVIHDIRIQQCKHSIMYISDTTLRNASSASSLFNYKLDYL